MSSASSPGQPTATFCMRSWKRYLKIRSETPASTCSDVPRSLPPCPKKSLPRLAGKLERQRRTRRVANSASFAKSTAFKGPEVEPPVLWVCKNRQALAPRLKPGGFKNERNGPGGSGAPAVERGGG